MIIFVFGAIFGLILGSFAKCIADRSLTESSFFGRSRCDHCQKTLSVIDLIPIIGFLLARGKCRHCHKSIANSYVVVELVTALILALLWTTSITKPLNLATDSLLLVDLVFKSLSVVVFVAVFLTDLETGLIPDRISIPASILALIYLVFESFYKIYLIYMSIQNSLLGQFLMPPHSNYLYLHALDAATPLLYSLLAGLLLGLFFGLLIFVTRGRGMGGGDLKLGIFIGIVLGLPGALLGLVLAFLGGSIFGISMVLLKRASLSQTIPFGPFLSASSIICLIWGNQILDWYLNLNLVRF